MEQHISFMLDSYQGLREGKGKHVQSSSLLFQEDLGGKWFLKMRSMEW